MAALRPGRGTCLAFGALLLWSSLPTTASARTTAVDEQRAAERALASREYRSAIDHFAEADRLQPSAAYSLSIARAYERLADPSRALAGYREYQRRAPKRAHERQVQARVNALAAVLATQGVQQITVWSSPLGATTFLDDEPIGPTPAVVDVTPGPHALTLRLDGHEAAMSTIDVPADRPIDVGMTLNVNTTQDQLAVLEEPRPAPHADEGEFVRRSVPVARPNAALRTTGLVALGAGVAALSGALAFDVMHNNADNAARHERDPARQSDDQDSARSRLALARVFAGAGGSLAALGGVMMLAAYAIPSTEKHVREGVAVACLPNKCQATVSGKF